MQIGNYIKTKNTDLIVLLLLIIIVIVFFSITGTVTSGYHFADDHEIIRINRDLNEMGFNEVTKKWITDDFSIRFRPLYYFVRVLKTKIFGTNLIAWSVYNVFLLCITLVFFYLSMRKLQFDIVNSMLFLLIILIGQQSAIWWRLGPNETLGITMLSISFFFASKGPTCKRRFLNNILFSFFLILSSLSKESFLIIIPGMIIFKVFNEKQFLKIKLLNVLRRNSILLIPFIIMFIELYIILKYVGTNKMGYVGIEESVDISTIFDGILIIIHSFFDSKFKIFALILILLLIYVSYQKKYNLKLIILPIVFFISIVLPNLVLYYKYGLWERYLIPSSIGVAFLLVSVIRAFKDKIKNTYIIILFVSFFLYTPNIAKAYLDAQTFSNKGFNLKELIKSVIDNKNPGSKVLLAVNPGKFYEQSYSLKQLLEIEYNMNIYGYALSSNDNDEFEQKLANAWYNYFENKTYDDLDTFPHQIVILEKNQSNPIFDSLKIDIKRYTNVIENNPLYANYKLNE